MDTTDLISQLNEQAANTAPIGDTIKFVVDDHVVLIDGTGEKNVISQEDKEASCTIITSADTLMQLKNGDLNPMMAVMGGKIKIKGDMSLAMKLQSLLT